MIQLFKKNDTQKGYALPELLFYIALFVAH